MLWMKSKVLNSRFQSLLFQDGVWDIVLGLFLLTMGVAPLLKKAGYVSIKKEFKGKKPHTMIRLTGEGRNAFRKYRQSMKQILDDLPD